MHFGLSDEQEMIVSTVRSFVENEIYPHEAEVEQSGQVRPELGRIYCGAACCLARRYVGRAPTGIQVRGPAGPAGRAAEGLEDPTQARA